MLHALTLIVPPGSGLDLEQALEAVVDSLKEIAGGFSVKTILAPNAALDLTIDIGDAGTLRAALREALSGYPVDWVVQPAAGRKKRLLVADMDSTIIAQECIDELAAIAGVGAEVAAITERAMRGEVDFEGALLERVAMLRGMALETLEHCLSTRITLNAGADTLIATMRHNGARAALVSGGFTFFTARIAARVGFDEHHANTLIDNGAALTGDVARPILGRAAKADSLVRLAEASSLALSETLAVGDGANDLGMISIAGLGVAYHAKPVVAAQAHGQITAGDLTSLLYFQGYSKAEFVQPPDPPST